jgi:predicted Zn-dependent protease
MKFFKITTSIILVVVLAYLVMHRKPNLSQQKLQTIPSSSEVNISQNTNRPLSTAELQIIEPTTSSHIKDPSSLSTGTPVLQKETISSGIQPQKVSLYENLNEGVSDTDESYRPPISPCSVPMGYRIGTFDSRFGISKTMFNQEIQQAGETWGDALGKKLFYQDEHGALTINLIYDERQARTVNTNYLALEIENSKNAAEQLRQYYEQEKVLYTKDAEQLTKDTENFQLRYKAYTDKVTTYNTAGGASKIEYDAMMSELSQLKIEAKNLEDRQANLLTYMESINKKVTKYNEFIVYINSLIKQSNALGAKKFTEGRYSPSTNSIDIYQYNDSIKLRRVLAHELGHVLGINHTENIYSIMYSVNSATTTTLSKEDRSALYKVCEH